MSDNNKASRELLKKAEMKRVGEKLTKKELCNIYGFNYNFYMNCISGRNFPSQQMQDSLTEYLVTPTDKVYQMVFATREGEDKFHDKLEIEMEQANKFLEELRKSNIFREPQIQ